MSYHNIQDLDLNAPPLTAALAPLWWNAPLPGWGGNPESTGPELVGVGSACYGCEGLGAAAGDTLNFGHVALGGSAGLLVGLLIGWVARDAQGFRRNRRAAA